MRHILTSDQFTKDFIEQVRTVKCNYESKKGKILGTLFFEPSTRTRWSTESAMLRLGGNVLSMEAASNSSSSKKGESLADTLRTCSEYCHILAVRHPENGAIEAAAQYSQVPVINCGSGSVEHPTQALIDIITILDYKEDITKLNIMFTGDLARSRTFKSLAKILPKLGVEKISVYSDNLVHFDGSVRYYWGNEIYHQLPHVDVLYMTRHQSEREGDSKKSNFVMDEKFAQVMKSDAIIMHPLPRNEEIHPSVDKDRRAMYFQQVKIGLAVRMKLLTLI